MTNEPIKHNVFDQDEVTYKDLADVISFKEYDFSSASYKDQERLILQPQLERLGYYDIKWSNGEGDSFGPLTRLCKAVKPDGTEVTFIYG